MKLSQLNPGDVGVLKSYGDLSLDVKKKLMVMGLLPETEFKFIRRAPMGDPIQIEVRGVSLALRESMAQHLEVRGS